jgi:hypothetical protein
VQADRLGLTWSVRDAAADEGTRDRVLADLSQVVRDACTTQFPEEAGYNVVQRRLWGALEGSTTEVRRGSFRAQVGVQRFSRTGDPDGGSEFRVVAAARHHVDEALVHVRARRDGVWLVVAGAAGTTGLGVVGLVFAGLLSTWGQLMLMLPLLMIWRMTMALRIADDLRKGAHRAALETTTRLSPGACDDLERWQRVLDSVAAQRDAVAEAFCGQGFRVPGAMPGSVAALAAGPLLPPAPLRRALPVPDLSMPPLGRTTAL